VSPWSNRFVELCALALLAACQSEPRLARPAADAAAAAPAATRPVSDNAGATDAPAGGTQPGAAASGALVLPATATRQAPGGAVYISGPTTVPEAAARQYSEALDLMKAGRSRDAELQLKQLSAAYPGLSGPEVNLGLLYLQGSKLPQAETAFKTALVRNPANAAAANELGIVERKLGKFQEAEAAYQRAVAAEPGYAPAHLNLGVLYDLYLGEPQQALEQFENYIQLAGENKQVAGWVAELRKRVGSAAPAAKKDPS